MTYWDFVMITIVLYGMKEKLVLVGKSDDDAIYRANGLAAGKVNVTEMCWYIESVIPSD